MFKNRKTAKARLGIESLETRQMMTGNVTVNRSGDNLLIIGDSLANNVEVFQTSVLDQYRVVGKSGTKINGVSGGSYTFTINSFKGDVIANMNGGNDWLTIRGSGDDIADLDMNRALRIDMGANDDVVELSYLDVVTDIAINMGTGKDDELLAAHVWTGGDFTVTKNKSSAESSAYTAIYLEDLYVGDDLNINLQNSTDRVNIINSSVNDLLVSLNQFDDALNVNGTKARSTSRLNGGAGNDDLNLYKNLSTMSVAEFKTPTAKNIQFI